MNRNATKVEKSIDGYSGFPFCDNANCGPVLIAPIQQTAIIFMKCLRVLLFIESRKEFQWNKNSREGI